MSKEKLKNAGCLVLVVLFVVYALRGPLWVWREKEPARMTVKEFVERKPDSTKWFELREFEIDIVHILSITGLVDNVTGAYLPLRPRGAGAASGPAPVVLMTEDPQIVAWVAAFRKAAASKNVPATDPGIEAMMKLQGIEKASGLLRKSFIRPSDDDKALDRIRNWVTRDCSVIVHRDEPSFGLAFWVLVAGLGWVGLLVLGAWSERWNVGGKNA